MKKILIMSLAALTALSLAAGCRGPKEYKVPRYEYTKNEEKAELGEHEASDYVTSLADYAGMKLTAEVEIPNITESAIDSKVTNFLLDYAEKNPVTDRGAKMGDCMIVDYRTYVDGGVYYNENNVEMLLGMAEIGLKADEMLEGAKAGDTVTFDTILGKTHGLYAGTPVSYEVDVKELYQYSLPELTDEFVTANTEYENVKAFREALGTQLLDEKMATQISDARSQVIAQVTDACTIEGYPQEMYDDLYPVYEDAYEDTAKLFGQSREDYITSYALKKEVIRVVKETLVCEMIANREGLSVTEDDYADFYENANLDTLESLEADYSQLSLKTSVLKYKVGSFLLNSAKVTQAGTGKQRGAAK